MPQFRNWSKLTVLSTFENRNLDFDLGILENMSMLEHVVVQVCFVLFTSAKVCSYDHLCRQGCNIKGTLPRTRQMINLQRLIAV